MKERTHGPWVVDRMGLGESIIASRVPGQDAAFVAQVARQPDAQLIAAAPDLLEACELVRAALSVMPEWEALAKDLGAIIAKAKGEQ